MHLISPYLIFPYCLQAQTVAFHSLGPLKEQKKAHLTNVLFIQNDDQQQNSHNTRQYK